MQTMSQGKTRLGINNQIDNTIVDKVEVDINHFPELKQLLSNDGLYDYKSKLFN